MELSLREIARICGGRVVGDDSKLLSGVSSLEDASENDLVFIAEKKYVKLLAASGAGAVLIQDQPGLNHQIDTVLVENPKLAFAIIAEMFVGRDVRQNGVSGSAVIDSSVMLPEDIYIGNFVSVGKGSKIGSKVSIGDGCHIGQNVSLGEGTFIHENVVIKDGTILGKNCVLHPGVVIGADGFGLVKDGTGWRKIPQLGNVVIGDNVDVGANTTIDRGALANTEIKSGVKLDNLIQIGHNVKIGENTVIAAHTAVAGSAVIGSGCEIGGCVGIMDHSIIGDDVKIGGGSVISGRIAEPGIYSSSIKAEKLSDWKKNVARLYTLNKLAIRIKKLEEK